MIVFTCYKAYKEEQAGFDFPPQLFCAGESVIVEAKGSPSVSCV